MRADFPQVDVYQTGQNIKRIMRERHMAVRDIQEYLGLSAPQSVYHWFDGKSLPTVDNLYALSELFCVPLDMLVCGKKERDISFFRDKESRRRILYYYGQWVGIKSKQG